jgi:hypothetical protein
MKLNEVVGARPTLEKVAAMEMEGGVALEFAIFVKNVLIPIQEFEVKRAELFQKYGVSEGEGENKNIRILPENEKKFNTAIKRALNRDIGVEPFSLASLGIGIAPSELINALPLFK